MNHQSLSRSEYAYQVYETLAAHQVSDDLEYDGARTITVGLIGIHCDKTGTEIVFPGLSSDYFAGVVVPGDQPATTVATVVEALLTAFALHMTPFAFTAADDAVAEVK